jgi:hypothetical protein
MTDPQAGNAFHGNFFAVLCITLFYTVSSNSVASQRVPAGRQKIAHPFKGGKGNRKKRPESRRDGRSISDERSTVP